ncbi:4126_t:CDS:2 [Ambispora gerdemannii]|uniref:4126_t:CDS:1 n=1 Tax=Ambispora gerdemannii TaxID=144530 RepID=A0A9N8Z5V4_9GLOM|nr:4126_t:CDS:2 [Ambispora gerdemannii]
MDRTDIVALAKNILRMTSTLATHISIPDVNPCSLCGKEIYSLASNPLYKEFTLASCGHIFHQKCLERYLMNGEAICPNKKCNKPQASKEKKQSFNQKAVQISHNKDNIQANASNFEQLREGGPVDSGDQTQVDEGADVILMNELGILGGEEQSSSKTTDQASSFIETAKETADLTRSVENTSSASNNPEILNENSSTTEALTLQDIPMDDVVNKNTPQIQCPICEKCFEEIYRFPERCPTCTSADDMETDDLEIPGPSDSQKNVLERLPKKDNPKRTAQALVNNEVRKQLPDTVSDDALRKKKERALKIFGLFNEIGEDKIQRIKFFTVSAISKLGQDEIDKILIRFASVGR